MKENSFKMSENRNIIGLILIVIMVLSLLLTGTMAFATVESSSTCLNNTAGEGDCKDCCDCLEDATARQACRDSCITKAETDDGFSGNTDIVSIDAPSVLGPNGNYSVALSQGSEQAAKTWCDESDEISCGDRRYCRDAVNAALGGSENPPEDDNSRDSNVSLDQALSDEAQMKTIAFSGVAFLTGDLCSNTFFPPGKVSDFFGFQYMRDITPNGFGHNTEYAGRVSNSVLSILNDSQIQTLVDMANIQSDQVDAYGYKRFSLIKAFLRLLENDIPEGTTGLDKTAVIEFTGDLYEIDSDISYTRASVLGGIVAELSDTQKAELTALINSFNTLFESTGEGGTIASEDWPDSSQEKPNLNDFGLTAKDGNVLVSTFATQLYSWYLGSVQGDTYFCPERHGTYFGSFYMKDIPPIQATEGVTIDTNLTAEMGQAFLDALSDTQEALVTGLVDIQMTDLNRIVSTRQTISEKLRLFMTGISVDEDEVKALVRQYGELEGEMMYHYATNFAAVGNSLTDAQSTSIMKLRTDYYEGFPAYQTDSGAYDCSGAWLYAARLDEMPEIDNTDFLFGKTTTVVADGAVVTLISDGFGFAEGPAADMDGALFFSDIANNIIYKWSESTGLLTFRENAGGANGLFFDIDGSLIACEGTNQQIVSIDSDAGVSVVSSEFESIPFNEPNDLWVAPDGGIYFTDPVYFASETPQGGEHVYYISPDRDSTIRVIDDMVRPNGIIGTNDGNVLYVTDHGAGATYSYAINSDGSLSSKTLFASEGGDGMTIDTSGNIYICTDRIQVYNSTGDLIDSISVPEQPTNVCFGGSDNTTLFITTRSALYSLEMAVEEENNISGDGIESDDESSSSKSCFINTL